jgi:hypothetical protein
MDDIMGALYVMQERDPDGWEHREPAGADYSAFEVWAVETYGRDLYRRYAGGGWAPTPTGYGY